LQAIDVLADCIADLVYLDADHTEQGIVQDIKLWTWATPGPP
jgi:hypothetical protein